MLTLLIKATIAIITSLAPVPVSSTLCCHFHADGTEGCTPIDIMTGGQCHSGDKAVLCRGGIEQFGPDEEDYRCIQSI
jgi:hypothetical protein